MGEYRAEEIRVFKAEHPARGLFKSIQTIFGDKAITLTIEAPHDETAFFLQHEINRKLLLKELEAIKHGAVQHTLTFEEVDALAYVDLEKPEPAS